MNGTGGTGSDHPRRGWLIARTALRASGTTTLLVIIYYTLPLGKHPNTSPLALLIVALIALTGLIVWQVRAISNSPYPWLKAVEALSSAVPLFLLSYAATYYLMGVSDHTSFSEALTRSGAIYFTVTVFSTVGFGDITPTTDTARLVVTSQMIVDLLILGIGLRLFVSAVRVGKQRHPEH